MQNSKLQHQNILVLYLADIDVIPHYLRAVIHLHGPCSPAPLDDIPTSFPSAPVLAPMP